MWVHTQYGASLFWTPLGHAKIVLTSISEASPFLSHVYMFAEVSYTQSHTYS